MSTRLIEYVDATANLTAHVPKSDSYRHGFDFRPKIGLSFPAEADDLFGEFHDHCTERNVQYSLTHEEEQQRTHVEIRHAGDIQRFLAPIADDLTAQSGAADTMLQEIVPALLDGEHETTEGINRLVRVSESLRADRATEEADAGESLEGTEERRSAA